MLTIDQISATYPENLRAFKESMLKEYLQYKILNSIYASEYGNKLVFLGGTALRIIYGSPRFSEDLDFDNLGLTAEEFTHLGKIIQKDLTLEGLEVEISTVTKKAYRIKIRLPKLLFTSGLAPMSEQKILIQVDTVPQHFEYTVEKQLLNKFDVFTHVSVVPINLLLSQKIFASINRKRAMGRDFFDIVFLRGLGAKPDYKYLKKTMGVDTHKKTKMAMLEKTSSLNFHLLATDVEPLLFDPRDKKKVEHFREFLELNF